MIATIVKVTTIMEISEDSSLGDAVAMQYSGLWIGQLGFELWLGSLPQLRSWERHLKVPLFNKVKLEL